MKTQVVWRLILALALASLGCSLFSPGSFLPPTSTPERVAQATEEEPPEDEPTDEPVEDDDDLDLDQDLDLGGQDEDEDDAEPTPEPTEEPVDDDTQDDDDALDLDDLDDLDLGDDDQSDDDECAVLEATSDVYWVTLNEDFEIEEQVDSYPGGVTLITPVFEYACVPERVEIVTVFSLDGEVVYSDQEALNASAAEGLYGYPLGTTDNSPLSDGEWGVEFYVDEEFIAGGLVLVGDGGQGDIPGGEFVAVEGSVVSAASGQPIDGALVVILEPGVTVQAFVENEYPQSEVYTEAETNSRGTFALPDPLERNVEYSLIVAAEGYQPLGYDGMVITDDLEEPVVIDIELGE